MTEAELYEQIGIYMGNCISAFTIYVSLTFGYLTVAFLVARRLTAFQAITATSIYVVAAFSCVFTLLAGLSFMGAFAAELADKSGTWSKVLLSDLSIWLPAMAVITTGGIIASVYFFHTVRRSEESESAAPPPRGC